MKAEIYPSPDGWRFRVKGDNGEIMAVGESYVRRIDAESALRTLFAGGKEIDVTVRSHHNEVVEHYHLGPAGVQDELPLENEIEAEDDGGHPQ